MNKMILTVTLNPCIDKTIIIDEFKYGGLNRINSVRVDVGGKGINVSKVLKNFGADVFACGITAGETGKKVVEFLDSEGIPNLFVHTRGEVRTNYKIVDNKTKITTELNEPGFYVQQDVVDACITNIEKMLPSTETMVLSGSIPVGVSKDIYKRLINIAKEYPVKVILDADGEMLRCGVEAVPYAIKPNLFEFEQLVGRKLDSHEKIISAAKHYINMGIQQVIISMGAKGAIFVTGQLAYLATPFEIECKSTVAAGDSMVAALAYGLVQGYDLKTIARLAVSAGTITTTKEGSDVCSLEEVRKNMPFVILEEL